MKGRDSKGRFLKKGATAIVRRSSYAPAPVPHAAPQRRRRRSGGGGGGGGLLTTLAVVGGVGYLAARHASSRAKAIAKGGAEAEAAKKGYGAHVQEHGYGPSLLGTGLVIEHVGPARYRWIGRAVATLGAGLIGVRAAREDKKDVAQVAGPDVIDVAGPDDEIRVSGPNMADLAMMTP